ncbi:hypothetical protein RAS12_16165 [Achromobacter seleniivolatilans]|uniref:Holin n=1 Tax=Achromobacter seleniivolatilans TaxID=3047478 RepID=A0ABY9LTX7_9BURK|nr:hypothetical protein [Achromobacter sp. R39]WMD18188.1 hypothetical protein RAS12_16165 [Achromobacter sp. R39]
MSKWRAGLVALVFLGTLDLMVGSLQSARYLEAFSTGLAGIAIAAWAAGRWSPFYIEWGPYQVLVALALGLGLISVVKHTPIIDADNQAMRGEQIAAISANYNHASWREPSPR